MERELFSAELKRRMKSLEIWIFYLSDSNIVSKVNLLTFIATEDLRLA